MQDDDVAPLRSWRQRPKPIGSELAYRIVGDVLEIESIGKTERVPLSTVAQVRFVYAPSNVTAKAYRTQLRLANGRSLTFGNLSWRSLMDIDRDDAGYHAFVAALAAAIAQANPQARFVAGKPFALWAALVVVGGLSMLMLAAFTLRGFQQETPSAGWIGLLLAAAAFCQVWPMVRLNRPRTLASGEVPDELVPGRIA